NPVRVQADNLANSLGGLAIHTGLKLEFTKSVKLGNRVLLAPKLTVDCGKPHSQGSILAIQRHQFFQQLCDLVCLLLTSINAKQLIEPANAVEMIALPVIELDEHTVRALVIRL